MRWVSLVVALLAWHLWNHKHAIQAQLFRKNLPPLFSADKKCELIQEKAVDNQFKFCEDGLVYAPGIAMFSCDPGRHEWNTVMGPMLKPDPRGSLWALHYNTTTTGKPYRLELTNFPTDADFHPLGIETTPADRTGTSRLLVVNHRRQNSTIEVFYIQRDLEAGTMTLEYEMTLTDPAFVAPNAIAAISPNLFVLSHDHYFTRRMAWPFNFILPPLETFLALPLGKVDLVTFEPFKGVRQVQTVARNIPFANGVAVSEDGSTLAIASTTRAEVLFYSLYANDKIDIQFVSSVQVPFSVDNLAFAGDVLLAAGHPYLPQFMALVKRKSNRAPSYVVEVAPQSHRKQADDGAPREISLAQSMRTGGASVNAAFVSDGSFLSSSSGAFMDLDMGTMFVVALYGSGVAKCSHV
ncbi:unnamed protein product [Rhizoctonia solani]|uniref:Uncharacterized protein n=1 Tax=Rhizoctonia solani TaxID=456999 RepID=A0A8H3B4D9_9AGAM|nr:unnamed protein product [Rhizoctonia solani]